MYDSITLQMGHVPRTSGSTGTKDEQKFTKALGEEMADQASRAGWRVELIGADPPGRVYPKTDLFHAIHCDGSDDPNVGSASWFYPPRDADAAWDWGVRWAAAHQAIAGYPFGFRRMNYVSAVSTGFYAWRASRLPAQATNAEVCSLGEYYFATNPDEYAWAWTPGRIAQMAKAHVAALAAWTGNNPNAGGSDMGGSSGFSMWKNSDQDVIVREHGVGEARVGNVSGWGAIIRAAAANDGIIDINQIAAANPTLGINATWLDDLRDAMKAQGTYYLADPVVELPPVEVGDFTLKLNAQDLADIAKAVNDDAAARLQR